MTVRPVTCPDCDGDPADGDECLTCGGDGWIEEDDDAEEYERTEA